MKVLITGATGFIGRHLIDANLRLGRDITAFTLPNDPEIQALTNKGIRIFKGDIRNQQDVINAAEGIDIIFHCAAWVSDWGTKAQFYDITVKGTEHVCEAAKIHRVKRLIKISTNDVFGLDESKVLDETCPLVKWNEPYSDTKIAAEEIAWKYFREAKVPVTMVYPCWVYGEGDKTFVPLLADAVLKGEMIFFRKGTIVWPTHIENLVDLLMFIAIDERAIGNGYLIHDGSATTLEDFTNRVAKTIDAKEVKTYIPYPLAYTFAIILEFIWKITRQRSRPLLTTYTVKNLGSRLRFSIEKAKKELNWTPPITYEEGMEKTMAWLKTVDLQNLKQK